MDQQEINMISVIVPVYKAEKYIRECIESILSQTYEDFELILVNDGSPDASGMICDQYAQRDSRVSVIHQNNQGVSAARNTGMQRAVGEYICFVDADDTVDREYLSILQHWMPVGGLAVCDVRSGNQVTYTEDSDRMTPEEAQVSALSGNGIKGYAPGKLLDAGMIREHGLSFSDDLTICEDLLFIIQYLKCITAEVVWNHSAVYRYRRNYHGAEKGRFLKHQNFRKNDLTEILALERCQPYLYSSEEIRDAYSVRTAKAAVNTLRTMVANQYKDPEFKNRMLRLIRGSVLRCIRSPYLAASSKMSVCAAAISPRLEFFIWKTENMVGRQDS